MSQRSEYALWLCLNFYALPLDRLQEDTELLAIAEKQRIVFVSDGARAAGVQPEMRLATAYALQPDIHIVERKLEAEAKALDQLAHWCYQFTPTVTTYKHFSILLDIGGSLTLFKGLSNLLKEIELGLRMQGFRYSTGLAHTMEGAWLLSYFQDEHINSWQTGLPEFTPPPPEFWLKKLKTIPLNHLDIDAKKKQQLFNLGLRSLNDLLDLPRADLGKRFGRDLLNLIASIFGEKSSLSQDLIPPQQFSAEIEFANGVTKIDELYQPIEHLLQKFTRFLQQHQLHSQKLEWALFYFKQPADTLLIHTSPANNTLQSLLNLSKIKLEQFQLKAPIELLCLRSNAFVQANAGSGELFPELSHPNSQLRDYQQLLDKLLTRLGDHSLFTLQVGDDPMPDVQQVVRELNHQTIEDLRFKEAVTPIKNQSKLPLWLSEKPIPISPPNHITINTENEKPSPLRLIYGPQRVDSHWWKERAQRDYFIARHRNGSYCWVFQDLKNERWFLQGFYG